MFVRRGIFEAVGGFPPWPLMEDVELARRMRGAGKLVTLAPPAVVSPRRWLRRGILRTYATMKLIKLGHALGASPGSLARLYARGRPSG
jgi:GT2 family glycosyltransferase